MFEWKNRIGIYTGIVSINDIYNSYDGDLIHPNDPIYDNAGKVRQYLYEAYMSGETRWALIAGDYYSVPIRYAEYYSYEIPSDWYFTDFNSNWSAKILDYSPDIFVGRLICSTSQDIINWTNNVLKYQQNPGEGNYDYLLKAFWVQADQMQFYQQAEGISPLFPMFDHTIWGETPSYNSEYNEDGYVLSDGSITSIMGTPKGADVIAEMNYHYGLFSWLCHGGSGGKNSGIATMSSGIIGIPYWKLDAEDANPYNNVQPEINNGLDNLNNSDYPSVLYSTSCDVTPFDITKSHGNEGAMNCGEAFTTLPHSGGVAFLGNIKKWICWKKWNSIRRVW